MESVSTDVSGSTGLIALLGHPVAHSLSPRMHNAALRAKGVDMVYLAFDVPPAGLKEAIQGLRALGFRGANVTVPHKESVVPLLDWVDELAARVGAVNTIVNRDGRLEGYNTDVAGFKAALGAIRGEGARGLKCLVAGAGGAARAVVAGLSEDGAAQIWIHNRTHSRALSLCEAVAGWGGPPCETVTLSHLRAAARSADLIVNATTVGLGSLVKDSAVPVDILGSRHLVMDVVYGTSPTMLMTAAASVGATALDGREMLVLQAADAFRLWTGLEPPLEEMRTVFEW